MKKLIRKGQSGILSKLYKVYRAKQLSKTINKVAEEGLVPHFEDPNLLFRTTTPKEVSTLSDGTFSIQPNNGNHNAYGWRKGAPFYQPKSPVELRMMSLRNNTSVINPVYLTTPANEQLTVRVGSGGQYGDPIPSTQVHAGTLKDYQNTGALYFPEESSVAFFPGDKLPSNINAWQFVNGKWQLTEILPSKRIVISSN